MGGMHDLSRIREVQQPRRQPHIHALEDDVVDQGEQIGDPAGIGGEDELPKHGRACDQIVKAAPGNGDGGDIGFGDAIGGVILECQHAGGGQNAAFTGMDAVQKHLAPGFGLTNRFIIDQHFRQRDRLGRLTAALAYNPFAIGIGLDEDTAAFISPDDTLEVEGSGAVTVVDAHDLQFSSMAQAGEDDPVCLLGLGVHILIAGATFNLHTRRASAGRLATRKT